MLRRLHTMNHGGGGAPVVAASAAMLCSAARMQSRDSGNNPVPPYRKPPAAPVNVPFPEHIGGGTHAIRDPLVRKQPNQPTRAPESAVLSAQRGLVLTQAELANPALLADRRLPLGEWLRRQTLQQPRLAAGAGAGAASSTLLQSYLLSLMLPQRGPPLGDAQQAAIARFEEETIVEAAVGGSREPSMEKARWLALARRFTAELHLFQPRRFEQQLLELHGQVRGFFGGDEAYGAELQAVYDIMHDSAVVERNSRLQDLAAMVAASAALEEGGLVWERFFTVVEQHRQELMRMCCSGGGGAETEQQLASLEAMWNMSRESAPPLLSPPVALLFVAATAQGTAPRAPDLRRLLEEQMAAGGGGEDSDALWAPETGAVARFVTTDELFRFCSRHVGAFLAPMDQSVADQLRRAGFAELADLASNMVVERATTMGGPAGGDAAAATTSRQQLVNVVATAFKRMTDVHSAVQSIVQNPHSSQTVTTASGATTTVRGFILELLQTMIPPERRTTATTTTTAAGTNNNNAASSSSSSAGATGALAAAGGRAGSGFSATDLQPLFRALEPHWEAVSHKFTTALLSNAHATKILLETSAVKGMSAGSQRNRELTQNIFTSERVRGALKQIETIDAALQERAEATARALRTRLLSSSADGIARCARMVLRSHRRQQQQRAAAAAAAGAAAGAAATSQQNEVLNLVRQRIAQATTEPRLPQWLLPTVIRQVAADMPSWAPNSSNGKQPAAMTVITAADLSGNYTKASNSSSGSDAAAPGYLSTDDEALHRHALLLRAYLRLTYVPHAANAVLKARHRRRIGPIATKPHEFNVDAEVGFAEEYNTELHKQWDWQGWYQRMMDVFHRNVSIRVRLGDMRNRLDNRGRPFVDLQTERRLRILAAERVGGGVLKLDSDRYEDRSDNLDYGTGKLQQLLSEGKKAQLGREYWPTVEVKVREPSGQSRLHYSLLDWDRVEARSAAMLDRYRAAKQRSVYVPPTETWLELSGASTAAKTATATVDSDGYTVDNTARAAKRKE